LFYGSVAATISSVTLTDVVRLFLSIAVRLSAAVYWLKSSAIVTFPKTISKRNFERTSRFCASPLARLNAER
jgi:hypothetical protein